MMLRASLLLLIISFATACGGGSAGKIMADTPILPYQAPDIDEITGIEPPDEEAEEEEEPEAAVPAPTPTPATPAGKGAAPAGKTPAKPATTPPAKPAATPAKAGTPPSLPSPSAGAGAEGAGRK